MSRHTATQAAVGSSRIPTTHTRLFCKGQLAPLKAPLKGLLSILCAAHYRPNAQAVNSKFRASRKPSHRCRSDRPPASARASHRVQHHLDLISSQPDQAFPSAEKASVARLEPAPVQPSGQVVTADPLRPGAAEPGRQADQVNLDQERQPLRPP